MLEADQLSGDRSTSWCFSVCSNDRPTFRGRGVHPLGIVAEKIQTLRRMHDLSCESHNLLPGVINLDG
ncbi:hypothetical protein V6N12_007554 [Hibiscus sabdariffa]|uniref:Uncharacterized protein n=1 Tax=Hibiscus sabdariffa TaxID=183260 RepID=A0ABR2F234_9ROSI